ncbi:MAG: ATP-binding protein [Gammaproteobacteria bacterium]|nr:MAG: ATP-binding protein [Gammaproteobacteria bacterium]
MSHPTYEKLGSFYLGSEISPNPAPAGDEAGDLVLYDAKDLTTHAVIIGMTGSGKTGLGACLLEEALLDGIPVIAVDPKGDMGNLLLNFPDMQAEQFAPYIDAGEAEQQGLSVDELAQQTATQWKKGLQNSHQSPERVKALHDAVGMNLFTPGATYGRPISLLKSLTAPNAQLKADKTLYRERIAAASTSMLALLGVENDPLSREHILMNTLLEHYWDKGQDMALVDLIAVIQNPPFDNIGVMDIDTIYPAKERLKLAMKLNNLLASPSFEAWTQGEAMNTESLLFDDKGKPQLSVMNIAHLSEEERLFFVTLLLNDILAWMRTQSGTGTLRAVLYIDELFGYMPPVGNPATKPLLLTLLKQARAYGLGLVLSTQNPVDLDYKGLSNAGTWFIGKLQTEQDRARVMDGLLSASEDGFDKDELNEAFNQLGKRKFLLHNIHESAPVIMTTRWAMSYLSGPLSRQHIERLCATQKTPATTTEPANGRKAANLQAPKDSADTPALGVKHVTLPADIAQYFLPPTQVITDSNALIYQPALLGLVTIHYEDNKSDVRDSVQQAFTTPFCEGAIAVDWRHASEPFAQRPEQLALISDKAPEGGRFIEPIAVAKQKHFYRDWEKALTLWVRQNRPLTVMKVPALKLYSRIGESESQFKQRIAVTLHENRDAEIDKLRQHLEKKLKTLENKLLRAEAKVEKEQSQASSKTLDAIISAGTTLFSAFLGRKTVSATNARRLSSTLRKAKGAMGERTDIELAKQQVEVIQSDIDELSQQFEAEQERLTQQYDINNVTLESVQIYPKASGVEVVAFGLAWSPCVVSNGELQRV